MHTQEEKILESALFKTLVRNRWMFSLTLTGIMLAVYFGFLLAIAFNKDVFGLKMTGGITIGVLLGLGIIVMAWILTGVYVFWANSYYDNTVNKLKDTFFK